VSFAARLLAKEIQNMSDFTYCSHTNCYYKDCARHQHNAPKDIAISIADLDDGFCFVPEVIIPETVNTDRERLLAAICRGTQKTNYKCDGICKALCGNDGTCAYCSYIADTIEEAFRGTDYA
jgi:hypothetical protein